MLRACWRARHLNRRLPVASAPASVRLAQLGDSKWEQSLDGFRWGQSSLPGLSNGAVRWPANAIIELSHPRSSSS